LEGFFISADGMSKSAMELKRYGRSMILILETGQADPQIKQFFSHCIKNLYIQ
jgi:hypothetical protein